MFVAEERVIQSFASNLSNEECVLDGEEWYPHGFLEDALYHAACKRIMDFGVMVKRSRMLPRHTGYEISWTIVIRRKFFLLVEPIWYVELAVLLSMRL